MNEQKRLNYVDFTSRATNELSWLGLHSLTIYLFHMFFA